VPPLSDLRGLRAASSLERVSLLQLLAILERTDIADRGPADPQAWFLFAEASRLMYADRDRFVADPAFVAVPIEGLLDPAYVDGRATLIRERAAPAPSAGEPPGPVAARFGEDATSRHRAPVTSSSSMRVATSRR